MLNINKRKVNTHSNAFSHQKSVKWLFFVLPGNHLTKFLLLSTHHRLQNPWLNPQVLSEMGMLLLLRHSRAPILPLKQVSSRVAPLLHLEKWPERHPEVQTAPPRSLTHRTWTLWSSGPSTCQPAPEPLCAKSATISSEGRSSWLWACHGILRNSTAITATPPWQKEALWRRRATCTAPDATRICSPPPASAASRRSLGKLLMPWNRLGTCLVLSALPVSGQLEGTHFTWRMDSPTANKISTRCLGPTAMAATSPLKPGTSFWRLWGSPGTTPVSCAQSAVLLWKASRSFPKKTSHYARSTLTPSTSDPLPNTIVMLFCHSPHRGDLWFEDEMIFMCRILNQIPMQ